MTTKLSDTLSELRQLLDSKYIYNSGDIVSNPTVWTTYDQYTFNRKVVMTLEDLEQRIIKKSATK